MVSLKFSALALLSLRAIGAYAKADVSQLNVHTSKCFVANDRGAG